MRHRNSAMRLLVQAGLGGAAVAATLLQARAPEGAQPARVPAPLPPPVRAEDRGAFEALPPETQNLCCRLETPADLGLLRRLPLLRCAGIKSGRRLAGRGVTGLAGPDR